MRRTLTTALLRQKLPTIDPILSLRRQMSSVTQSLQEAIQTALVPTHLEIRNESYKHKGPPGAESHFQVIVVSDQFVGKPLLKRHRLVNAACQTLLDGPIHALSIVAKAPEQWASMSSADVPGTPNCRGGDGSVTAPASK
jgi:BolA protein